MTNAFQQAAAQVSQQQAPAASAPAGNPLPFNRDNLFAAPSDFKGGAFTPTAPLEALAGRTLVYIPRSFNPTAPDPFSRTPGATRKLWTADLYVIDGGELRFFYEKKGDPNATPPTPPATVEQVFENCTPQTPYVMLNTWVGQAAIMSKLSAASEARQLLIGTPVRGATKAQMDKGATDASVREAYDAWVARGKPGERPQYLWLLADVADMAPVMAWYEAHKDSIKL